ncbi:MAG: family 43 glycosylhydrolase [Agriterribacter sp.]
MKRRDFMRASGMLPFMGHSLLQAASQPQPFVPGNMAGETGPRDFFYKPENAVAADFIPLYAEGKYQLFYLLDWRNAEKHGEGTPWYRLSTTDFVHFEEHGEVIPRGTREQQDLFIFTGSAIQAQGKYHIFYTGHNHHLAAQDKPMQAVMHATSNDLQHWTKIPADTFFAPADRYEKNDWRDPFVFYNEETKMYNMLLAARFRKGIPRRRGLTALCSSKDLVSWKVEEPFYAPNEFFTHECPDLFKMGDWWYLVFSEFTDKVATRYRMSRSLKGPWIVPAQDTFDGHAFYAAKTASDGKQRFIFGWNPTRSDEKDNGGWNWGGNLVVHEVIQQPNGELTVRVPATVAAAFNKPATQEMFTAAGESLGTKNKIEINANGRFDAVKGGMLPAVCKLSATVSFTAGTQDFGCMLRCSDDLESAYYIRLEPARNRVVFDMWPRSVNEVTQMVELERQVMLSPGKPVTLQIFLDGNKGVVYVNNMVAMNFRAYNLASGSWALFASQGRAVFSDVGLSTL